MLDIYGESIERVTDQMVLVSVRRGKTPVANQLRPGEEEWKSYLLKDCRDGYSS